MIEDLTMIATLPVADDKATAKEKHGARAEDHTDDPAQLEADKAAAAETLPPPKRRDDDEAGTDAERVARRGQDPPEPEKPGPADS